MKFLLNDTKLKERRRELRRNQTDAERVLWARVRNGQFFGMKFFRQYSVGPFILDFYCPVKKLAIELDGGQHNLPEGKECDVARTAYLKGHGIEVIRYWNNEVLCNLEAVLTQLEMKFAVPPNADGGDKGK
jgi:very-short-patch-repair endonuclease